METNLINFETFQAVSFTLTASLASYFIVSFIGWCIKRFKNMSERPLRR